MRCLWVRPADLVSDLSAWRLPLLWAIFVAVILIEAIIPEQLPPDITKADIGNKLRDAARLAGCTTPVVSIDSQDMKHFHYTVVCRDHVGERDGQTPDASPPTK